MDGWNLLLRDGPKKVHGGLVIVQSDTPHFILDLLVGIHAANDSQQTGSDSSFNAVKAVTSQGPPALSASTLRKKRWLQFWK
ncbi:MAG: hypothetical protein HZA01_17035 [Nitrospinae bacterium]|nr:hypothetical protein [Nitrospinota bacterium]